MTYSVWVFLGVVDLLIVDMNKSSLKRMLFHLTTHGGVKITMTSKRKRDT